MFEEQIAAVNKMIEEEKNNVPTCQKPQKRTYTVDEIMDILSLSRNGAYALIRRNEFHSVRIGGRIRISCKSFDEWLDQQDE